VLQDGKLVEDDRGARQHGGDGVAVRPVHVDAHRLDRGPLAGIQPVRQQRRQTGFAPIAREDVI